MTTNIPTKKLLPIHGGMSSWYQPSFGPAPPRDIANEAYRDAIRYLEMEVRNKDLLQQLVGGKTTIQDVRSVVEKAKSKYESTSQDTSARRWLRIFSTRVMYYSPVFDVLAQHHPEYVALAWGSVKFVLIGIINHANLVSQFSRALAEIGEALWQTKLSAELYRIEHMKEAISRLYAHIILFFQQSVKWYGMNSAERAISSIFKPFELDYKDTVEEIKLCSQTINDIAGAASRAEIRDLHDIVKKQYKQDGERDRQDKERDEKLQQMQMQLKGIQEKMESSTTQILQAGTVHKSITENIHVEVLKINPNLQGIQFFNIVQTLRPVQSPEESFAKAQSLTRRNASINRPSKDWKALIESLGPWISADESALFVVRVALRAEAKARGFAVEVIKTLRSLQLGVMWNLSLSKCQGKDATLQDMIKSLIFQALVHDPTILARYPTELDAVKFISTHTEAEWISLLSKLLSRLSKCFIVVEAQDMFQIHKEDPEWAGRFFQLFQNLIDQAERSGNRLKILVLGYGTPQSTLQSLPGGRKCIVSCIPRPNPMPARSRRRFECYKKTRRAWKALKTRG